MSKEYKRNWYKSTYKTRVSGEQCVDCMKPVFKLVSDGRLKVYKRCHRCLKRMAHHQEQYRDRKKRKQNDSRSD